MDSQPAATLASRPAPPEAPQGWSVGWSETHQRWYFVNIETNLTQWKRPEQASQQQPVPTPGHDVNAPTESPLPAGWTSHWSEEHHHFYYLNTATGKSQWEPPLPEKIRDTAELPSQLRPPTQAKHARSSSQPPMRSGSKSEHKQADSTPGDLFSNPQSRGRQPASEEEFHVDKPERPKSHVFAPFDAPQPLNTNTGVYTPPMWSYGVPDSTTSSPGGRGRQTSSPGQIPAELDGPAVIYASPFAGAPQTLTPSPPRLSPSLTPQHPPTVPSALNPFSQGPTGAFLNPGDSSRPSSRNSETEILPAYSYSPGFSSRYSSYQPVPDDSRASKRFSAWNPDMAAITKEPAVGIVHHPENYDFLP
ncbi:unnamed protein product [Clonostachys rosea f. rosea IK726]|uniref:Uncharacterized protein n=1 Tax=Clonostachys rosea f. rosea IK726 TaxID=1349383 RepID=A0ACA9UH26_BIOOC|nr:unnamed protein product [Clonostachys rosea f. rosea IK726]